MENGYYYHENTPSVSFNFEISNQKYIQCVNDKDDSSSVPYDYSCQTSNYELSAIKKHNDNDQEMQYRFVTPPSHIGGHGRNFVDAQSCKVLLPLQNSDEKHIQSNQQPKFQKRKEFREICVKLNAESFFDELDANFVVNFGESSQKVQSNANVKKTFEMNPTVLSKGSVDSKIGSHISAPLVCQTSSIGSVDQENEEDAPSCKHQNVEPEAECKDIQKSQLKVNINQKSLVIQKKEHNQQQYQIRRRILYRNSEKLPNNENQKKERFFSKSGNQQNLMVVVSKSEKWWTDFPKNKKSTVQMNTHSIKTCEKTVKKTQKNIFNTRQMFKETLKSTTLDNWKKKFNIQKQQLDSKYKTNPRNIFQIPFAIIR